ncbi:hypothetical protein GOBAR_DD17207 [Gossypium barbadense]|nr:hypothetical protein GOBAR_DD17207 [Gossypium barbadense]
MKSRGSDDEEEDWDPVVVLASLKNAKLDAKAALQLEKAKREVHERLGIEKDKKDKEEASPKDEDNEVSSTVRGCDAILVLASLATVQGSIATNAIYRKIKKKQQKASSEMGDEELSRCAVTEHPMP